MTRRRFSDDDLVRAVRASRSWRGVLRELGLNGTSAGSARSVRRRAEELRLRYDHFTGQRTWTDGELAASVSAGSTWSGVATSLGLVPSGSTVQLLRAHACRLHLTTAHLEPMPATPSEVLIAGNYQPAFLRSSASLFAATWFTLRGANVAWPLEPCRYDLLVDDRNRTMRVQVKSTTGRGPQATVQISNSRRSGRTVYAPGEIDAFFLVDAGLSAFLIPYADVAGRGELQLGRYVAYRVVDDGQLIATSGSCAPAP